MPADEQGPDGLANACNVCRMQARGCWLTKHGQAMEIRAMRRAVSYHQLCGTADHCCACIPAPACVEHFVDLHAASIVRRVAQVQGERLLFSGPGQRMHRAGILTTARHGCGRKTTQMTAMTNPPTQSCRTVMPREKPSRWSMLCAVQCDHICSVCMAAGTEFLCRSRMCPRE